MQPIDIQQSLFDLVSNLTGGLVNDVRTLLLGLLLIAFIAMAIDLLGIAITNSLERRTMDRNFERAQDFLETRNKTVKGTASWDYYNMKYRNALRRSM